MIRRKLVSFSLFGTARLYLEGAVRNAHQVPEVYPGWGTRFYVSQEVPEAIVDRLKSAGAEVVRKVRSGPIDGMFWRFLPAEDSDLEAVVVRDVDSRPTPREFQAVRQWIESGRLLHVMRDHPCHRVVILGGMWGCRGGAVPDMAVQIERWRLWGRKGLDQDFLRDAIYPRLQHSLLVHSDLFAFGDEDCRPFPEPRVGGEFVGCVVDPDRDTLTESQHRESVQQFEGMSFRRLPPAMKRNKLGLRAQLWIRNLRDRALGRRAA